MVLKKNSGYELITSFKYYVDRILESISARIIFPRESKLLFAPDFNNCLECSKVLNIEKTRTKTCATLDIGMFKAHETVYYCPKCESIYSSEKLRKLIPHLCTFGYDIIVYVGKNYFLRCRSEEEIRYELQRKNIDISISEIEYLAKKFIVYLSIAHKESEPKLKKFLHEIGGYILHIDATCEGDSPCLMTGLDGISEIVLKNIKIPSEKAESIIPFLQRIKEAYGNPIALVHDMGKGIIAAVEKVFKGIADYICHLHFLRDIGKDLFGNENDIIRKQLRKYGIQGLLRKRARAFKKIIENNPELIDSIVESLNEKKIDYSLIHQMPVVAAYILILWALDGKNQGEGYGFPFDRPYLIFYQRLKTIYSILKKMKKVKIKNGRQDKKPYIKVLSELLNTINDTILKKATCRMEEKMKVFDKLRVAMRIALPYGVQGLNDNGDDDIKTIEKNVKAFYNWLCNEESLIKKDGYDKMITQIEKYWDKLFADPIIVYRQGKKIIIQPQRTNNILEILFRFIKRNHRKRSGTSPSSKTIKAMLAETPLIKNLENQDYMNILLDGKESLEERFAEIDVELVREELLKAQKDEGKIPAKINKIIKDSKLPETLVALFMA